MVLDFLPEPFGKREPHYITRLGTCPVRFVGDQGSVETGDNGEIVVEPASLQKEIPGTPPGRIPVSTFPPTPATFSTVSRTRSQTAANPDVMRRSHIACHAAAIAWILKRKLTIDPVKEEFVGDDDANLLRSRAARNWVV